MKKRDCLLNVNEENKALQQTNEDTTPAVPPGSDSKDALLAKEDHSDTMLSINDCSNQTSSNNNNNNDKMAKFESSITFGDNQGYPEQQDRRTSRKCPWRGMTMAVLLLLFGSLLIMAGVALISGAFQLKGLDNVTPYLILVFGALCFIPGAYHILVACCALRGHSRFSFDDIPYFG